MTGFSYKTTMLTLAAVSPLLLRAHKEKKQAATVLITILVDYYWPYNLNFTDLLSKTIEQRVLTFSL